MVMSVDDAIGYGCGALTLGLSLTVVVVSFRDPNYAPHLHDDHYRAANAGFCHDAMIPHVRPFRFGLHATAHGSFKDGPFWCPWPKANTVLRAIVALVTIVASAAAMGLAWLRRPAWLRAAAVLHAACASLWVAAATLDAAALATGNALCRDGFVIENKGEKYPIGLREYTAGDLVCLPTPYAWLVVANFVAVFFSALSTWVWFKYAGDDDTTTTIKTRRTSHRTLADPFLTSQAVASEEDVGYEPAMA